MNTPLDIKNDMLINAASLLEKFPLLAKYVNEMPVLIPETNDPEIAIKNLKEYNNSLGILLKKYAGNVNNK
ncbi:hypothetical protein [Ferruginibacter sp.]